MKHAHWLVALAFVAVSLWGCGDDTVCTDTYDAPTATVCESSSDCSDVNCDNICATVEAEARGGSSCDTDLMRCTCPCKACFTYR
ncbi:MAG: hypothetical protein PVH21_11120 [Myxococcales bacterium]